MSKALLIPIAVVLALPGMYFGGALPLSVDSEVWSFAYAGEELVEYSSLIMRGTLSDSYSYVEWHVSGGMIVPSVYTVWTIEQSEAFKGSANDRTEFVVNGGTYNNIVHDAMSKTELSRGDDVIVFLAKNPDSVYGNHYYMTGIESGIYKIDDGRATNNYTKSSYEMDSLKDALVSSG